MIRGLRRATRAEKLVATAVCFSLLMAALGGVVNALDLARRRRALAGAIEEERAVLGVRPRALVATMDDVVLEAARRPYPGDLVAPEVAGAESRSALLASTALYVRAALPEVERLDAIAGSVRRSEKDAFVLCWRHPPASARPEDIHAAATRYWIGGALFEDATHDVLPLSAVHAGLRPLSHAFSDELALADSHLWLGRLESEYSLRTSNMLALARTAANVDIIVTVVDELPDGVAEPEVGRSLTATRRPALLPRIEDMPHFVRVGVWSAVLGRTVLRVRTRVDVTALGSSNATMAAPHVQGCQAAMALREAPPAPASPASPAP